ncbi:hypothetical protein M1N48_00425 [Dehalococcoidia bacterium]|nr:hypothetical protein [Dehalococcoidia bacterium]
MCLKFYWKSFWILSLLVIITLFIYIQPVSGQTTAKINLVSSEALSDFPENVSFKLTVDSVEKIRSIKFFYRVNSSNDWNTVVKRFDNRYHITTEFVLNTSGSHFLTPESTIKYFYNISDDTGFTLKTKENELQYSDPRYNWDNFTVYPLTIYYHDQPDSNIKTLSRDLVVQIETLKDMYSIANPDPIKGIVYNHRSELANVLPDKTTIPEIYHGFAFLDQQIFLGIELDINLITHESSHLLLAQAMKDRINPLPAWLQEGISSYLEPNRVSFDGHSLSKLAPPLSTMESVPNSAIEIAYFYRKSESVVSFLIHELHPRNGLQLFQTFLSVLGNEPYPNVDKSLYETFGITIEKLDEAWGSSFRGLPSPSRGTEIFETPSPFLFLDTWLLGGLSIFVLGIVGVRFLKHKIYPGKDKEYMGPGEDDT